MDCTSAEIYVSRATEPSPGVERCASAIGVAAAPLPRGDLANVSFSDVRRLVESFGFELRRTSGSHHIFVHPDVPELLNLQEVRGQAKPYQIRQFLRLVERYALNLEDER